MPTVEFVPFADGPGANVLALATYIAGTLSQGQNRDIGFLGGTVAESQEANRVWRQASMMAAALAHLIADATGQDVLDDGNLPNLTALLKQGVASAAGRVKVTTPIYNLYVDAVHGNDNTGDGSSGNPYASIGAAWFQLANHIDLNGNKAAIYCAPGTYGPFLAFPQVLGSSGNPSDIFINGDYNTPTNCTINAFNDNCCYAAGGAAFTLKGFALQATGTAPTIGNGIVAALGAIVQFDRIDFGNCSTSHLSAGGFGFIGTDLGGGGATYTISGNAQRHQQCDNLGYSAIANSVVTISTSLAIPTFAWASNCSVLRNAGCTFSAPSAVTGAKYLVDNNSVIDTVGGGASYFPGNSFGSSANGGVYV